MLLTGDGWGRWAGGVAAEGCAVVRVSSKRVVEWALGFLVVVAGWEACGVVAGRMLVREILSSRPVSIRAGAE